MQSSVFRFAEFELDQDAYELRLAGRALSVERIPLDLLFLLVERPERLVTRKEILDRVWGKSVFVDAQNAVNSAVRKLRRALNDDPQNPRFVATVPTKGYRFIGPVDRREDDQLEVTEPSKAGSGLIAETPTQLGARRNSCSLPSISPARMKGNGRSYL